MLCVQINHILLQGISAMMMAMQTPVLSISIQDMWLSDVIFMSRHNLILLYKLLCHLCRVCSTDLIYLKSARHTVIQSLSDHIFYIYIVE